MGHCCQSLSLQERARAADLGIHCSADRCAREQLLGFAVLVELALREGWLAWES